MKGKESGTVWVNLWTMIHLHNLTNPPIKQHYFNNKLDLFLFDRRSFIPIIYCFLCGVL